MAKLNIKTYPDRILKEKAEAINTIGDEERKLAYDMMDTMRKSDGVGLAAPQVGISRRMIVVLDVEGSKTAFVFVNPKITKKRGKARFCEGCLSVPGVTNDVIRPECITLEALNIDGEKLKIKAEGLLARIIQHEADHLDGILFIDRVGLLKRKKILKRIGPKACMEL